MFSCRDQGEMLKSCFFFFPPADGLLALSFSISSLTLVGMLAVITYTVSRGVYWCYCKSAYKDFKSLEL